MATDATAACSSTSSELKCFIHSESASDDDLKAFNATTWAKVLTSAAIWKYSDGKKAKIATDFLALIDTTSDSVEIPQQAGFHRKCYQQFTDKTKVYQAKRKQEKAELEDEDSSKEPELKKPRRELRSREAATSSRRSVHVLPAECIICQKSGRLDVKKQGKRVKEPLSNCEIVNGGRILEQAINEQNTRILRLIQHQDCVALEVKYHATCYLDYTRPLTRKGNKQKHDRHYTESFKKFCKDVVEEKLIKEEKAWGLVALKKKFVQVVAEVEKVNASSYKTNSLKGRLQSTYPCLRFARPKSPNESDIVYAKQLSAETLFANSRASVDGPSGTDTSTDSEEDEGFVLQRRRATGSTLTEMYNSAIYLKKEIEDIPTQTMPWPPDSTHLTLDTAEKIVPTKLYNFLSLMVGFNEDPEGDKFVTLPEEQHRRILSLSQDIIYLTSKGRKAMPKQTSLAMAVRHITGSAQLIGLLNGFGHATSHTKVLEHDTALAKKEIQNGENKIPSCLERRPS